jgi:hypothetical protein
MTKRGWAQETRWTSGRGAVQRGRDERNARQQYRSRGQSIIIFALTLTVLLGFAGLAIDVARIYDLYARMQRAAEAGVLAGVLYMPNNYNTALPPPGDGMSAVSRALAETYKDGFGPPPVVAPDTAACPTPFTATEVSVCPVTGKPNDLRVAITETTPLALLSALGLRPITLTTSAQAEYMPPFPVGLDNTPNFFGDQGECNGTGGTPNTCSPSGNGAHVQNFMANIEGPADLKESGDPFVYCEEGPSDTTPPQPDQGQGITNGQYDIPTYEGLLTNHTQYADSTTNLAAHCGQPVAGGNPGNPDQQPAGYNGPATSGNEHPGAYNYAIVVPDVAHGGPDGGGSVWIYNANYVPFIDTGNSCPGRQPTDTFRKGHGCTGWATTYGTQTFNGNFDDPYFYFNVTYTLYWVTAPYFRGVDVPIWQAPAPITQPQLAPFGDASGAAVPVRPYDMMTQDLQLHGCQTNGSQVYDLAGRSSYPTGINGSASGTGACLNVPPTFQQWQMLADNLPAGLYRLAVEVTGYNPSGAALDPFSHGWGKHNYGLKVCVHTPPSAVGCPSGGSVSAWNNMDITMSFPSANAQNVFPLADIPMQYAGRLINIGFYDPGDSDPGNDSWFAIVPPATDETGTLTNPAIAINYGHDCQGNPQEVPPNNWLQSRIQPMPNVSGGPANGQPSIRTSANGDNIFNGLWIRACVQLPPGYVGGLWKMDIFSSHGTNTDTVAISFALVGSPVHLVTP